MPLQRCRCCAFFGCCLIALLLVLLLYVYCCIPLMLSMCRCILSTAFACLFALNFCICPHFAHICLSQAHTHIQALIYSHIYEYTYIYTYIYVVYTMRWQRMRSFSHQSCLMILTAHPPPTRFSTGTPRCRLP